MKASKNVFHELCATAGTLLFQLYALQNGANFKMDDLNRAQFIPGGLYFIYSKQYY